MYLQYVKNYFNKYTLQRKLGELSFFTRLFANVNENVTLFTHLIDSSVKKKCLRLGLFQIYFSFSSKRGCVNINLFKQKILIKQSFISNIITDEEFVCLNTLFLTST